MEPLAPAAPAPTTEEIIAKCGKFITDVMRSEMSDEIDPDRIYILRQVHKNYLYYRALQYFAPSIYQGIVDATGVNGSYVPDQDGFGAYDYNQNIYRGYSRKFEAVLGNRMPNAIAVPDNQSDQESAKATRSANNAALYFRQSCNLELQILYLTFGLFNFGTNFWHIDYVFDGEKYGYKTPDILSTGQAPLGNASFNCPNCGNANDADADNPTPPSNGCASCGQPLNETHYQPPTMADIPTSQPGEPQPNGALEISLHDASEVDVPLDATCINDCPWLVWSREKHKFVLMKKYGDKIKDSAGTDMGIGEGENVCTQYAENIRSAMASPIGLVRSKRANRWTERFTWWTPAMYEGIEDKEAKQMMKDNFPTGVKITAVRGNIIDMEEQKLTDRWQEVKPEPAKRIMADPLGNDWIEAQDLTTNMLNQRNEIIERSNEPGFGDPTRIDFDAWQRRRAIGADLFPALKPAGGSLSDIIYRPPTVQFSDQIAPFSMEIEQRAQNVSGLGEAIWGGGDAEEPTARQAELKKNAALMQLGVPWKMMGKSLEAVYLKACRLLGEYAEGVINFTQKNQFGRYDDMVVVMDDLKHGKYHFDFDEAIPLTYGQQRDLLMWMLDKPKELLDLWGFNDVLNIFTFKQLLGMPGERTPHLDDRDKGMDVIDKLLSEKPVPGQPNPDGSPGQQQASIQPDWEDDKDFMARLVKAFLIVNSPLKQSHPDGYQNCVLYGQACEAAANTPAPPPPPKTSVALSVKGSELGSDAIQASLDKLGIIPDGVKVAPITPPLKPGEINPATGQQVPMAPPSPLMPQPPIEGAVQ